ncbi:5'-methylthioadenosine/S-adenosylhomocysteine nucleosidase [Kitasatospora aureofaciens]|uniref:5'-methylthioadenosine/S-adenosylhomocysteine nucleosidase family protein n=1 Tax=Kitasatospora aureofaciens TaxID=1894 RepID=UPI00068B838B|nr:5'-methylthioadenosine/S-adenosylhomocysteine nucleosidase [Kitasatospora aureofaciens]
MFKGEFDSAASPIVVLTAISLEFNAAREHLVDPRRVVHENTWCEVGTVTGSEREVILAEVGPGNLRTAVVAEQLRSAFAPRAIIFIGVAGSLKADVRLGDVVVATKIYAYDGSKHDSDEQFSRPTAWNPSHALLQTALHGLRGSAWRERVRLGDYQPDRVPEVHFKPIAAGETVLNSLTSPLRDRLVRVFNDAVAVEMESAGLAMAADLGRVDALTIRGISDYADGAKTSADALGSQQIAAAHAAATAMAVIAALPVDHGADGAAIKGINSPAAPGSGPKQVNRADRNGVVNAVQNGNQTINNGPRAADR